MMNLHKQSIEAKLGKVLPNFNIKTGVRELYRSKGLNQEDYTNPEIYRRLFKQNQTIRSYELMIENGLRIEDEKGCIPNRTFELLGASRYAIIHTIGKDLGIEIIIDKNTLGLPEENRERAINSLATVFEATGGVLSVKDLRLLIPAAAELYNSNAQARNESEEQSPCSTKEI